MSDVPPPEEPPELTGVDGVQLTGLEWRIYRRAGIEPAEVAGWVAAGIRPYQAESYRDAGIGLALAGRLSASGVGGAEARKIGDVAALEALAAVKDADRAQLAPFTSLGLDRDTARAAVGAGIPPGDIERLLAAGYRRGELGALIQAGIPVDTAVTWGSAGVPMPHVLALWRLELSADQARSWSDKVGDADVARSFADHGFQPDEAEPWWREGVGPAAARQWRRHGFATGAQPWLRVDFKPAEAQQWSARGFGAEAAAMWAVKGFTLDEAQRWEQRRIDAVDAAGWVAEGFDVTDAVQWSAWSIGPSAGARWRSLGVEPYVAGRFAARTVTPELFRALEALGYDADVQLGLIEVGSITAAQLDAIRQRGVHIDQLDGRDIKTLAARIDDAIERPAQGPSAMRVTRRLPDGSTSVIAITGEPGAWTVDRDGAIVLFGTDSIIDVIRAEPDLHEIRAGVITFIDLDSDDQSVVDGIAELLVVTDPTQLEEDLTEWPDDDEESPMTPMAAVEGLGTRGIWINGRPWAVGELVESSLGAVVIPADPETLADREMLVPLIRTTWASLSAIEWGSMTAGWSDWELGVVSGSVLCEHHDLYETERAARLSPLTGARRSEVLADWVDSGDFGFDILPLAVRTAKGLDTTNLSPFGVSESLETDLWLDLDPVEVEHFVDLLRIRHGDEAIRRFLVDVDEAEHDDDDEESS